MHKFGGSGFGLPGLRGLSASLPGYGQFTLGISA